MRPPTTDREWTLSAPTLSPYELETALLLALGDELAREAARASVADDEFEASCPYDYRDEPAGPNHTGHQ